MCSDMMQLMYDKRACVSGKLMLPQPATYRERGEQLVGGIGIKCPGMCQ